MTEYIQVITTVEHMADAEKIAKSLLEKRLAACAQIIGPMTSYFHWQEKLDSAQEYLPPGDIRQLIFEAELLVLSRTVFTAASRSIFDNRLGFVSEFLEAGVSNVIASFWSGEDSETAAFMREFYRDLESTRDVAEALSRTRMRQMEISNEANFRSWAGFQLFIR